MSGARDTRLKTTVVTRLTESEESILIQLTQRSKLEDGRIVSSASPGKKSDDSDKPTTTITPTVTNMTEE